MKENFEKIVVNIEQKGKRIDSFLADEKEISRENAKRLIEYENVKVNGKKTKPSYKIQENDIITVIPEEIREVELKAQDIPLEILYEDNDILVVNKPKGMVVHPANGNPDGTLVNAVMALCKDSLSGIGGELRPGIVHRLDKDTSGAIIIAKNDKAHIKLSEMLKNHEIENNPLELSGKLPQSGMIYIKDGSVAIVIYDSGICAYKNYNQGVATASSMIESECAYDKIFY